MQIYYDYWTLKNNPTLLDGFDSNRKVKSVPVLCSVCKNGFWRQKHQMQTMLKFHGDTGITYCSKKCKSVHQNKSERRLCGTCMKETIKTAAEIRRSKSGQVFCSVSCGTKYNNYNKTHGTTRSKLEKYLEKMIEEAFPEILCLYNSKQAIGSELDFYFPSLSLAIELNGVFHYEPIHGQEKLSRIQNNDRNKYAACRNLNIELIIVPSTRSYYKQKDLDDVWVGIRHIISTKIGSSPPH